VSGLRRQATRGKRCQRLRENLAPLLSSKEPLAELEACHIPNRRCANSTVFALLVSGVSFLRENFLEIEMRWQLRGEELDPVLGCQSLDRLSDVDAELITGIHRFLRGGSSDGKAQAIRHNTRTIDQHGEFTSV
jgi:hypothetical protein